MPDEPVERSGKKGVKKMATQIASTPTVYGEEAKKIIEAAKKIPSQRALENAQKLIQFFEKVEKRGFK